MRSKFIRRLGAACFVGFLAISVIAGVLLAEGTLHPVRRPVSAENEEPAREMAIRHDSESSDVVIVAADGATFRAWSIRPSHSKRSGVILLHGLSDNRIPVRHSRQIAAGNRDVALWEVPNADHCGAISA